MKLMHPAEVEDIRRSMWPGHEQPAVIPSANDPVTDLAFLNAWMRAYVIEMQRKASRLIDIPLPPKTPERPDLKEPNGWWARPAETWASTLGS